MLKVDYDILIKDNEFLREWKKEVRKTLVKIHPEWKKDDINDELDKIIKEKIQLPEVTLHNNYTGEKRDTHLLSVLHWILKRKPLVAGNATFYKNQNEAINPVAQMLKDFLNDRSAIKKQMFSLEDKTSDLYNDLDREQNNKKRLANSYYGGSGMKASAFYSEYSGPATTGTAQSVISTTETLFESFLSDNYKFIDINECIFYMNKILDDNIKIPKWIKRKNKSDLLERLKNMFYEDIYIDDYDDVLDAYVNHLNDDEITYIYYKSNFIEFTNHDKIIELFNDLFSSIQNLEYAENVSDIPDRYLDMFKKFKDDKDKVKEYNKFVNNQYFMDPNKPPDTIIDILKKINDYYMKFVYVPFLSIDRIYRLKYFKRKVVCIVDTDSNILALDNLVDFFEKNVLSSSYGRDEEHNLFIIINCLAYFIGSAVSDILNLYGINSYIPEDYRSNFSMKNEFYFNKLVIGRKKKRYISSIKLREGNLLDPYKPDIKGFDFNKATTSEEAKDRFNYIVKRYILESDVPDTSGILRELKKFESEIKESIKNRNKDYLPLGNAKELAAYKKPYSKQEVRGTVAWNFIYPDNEIDLPSKISLLKLNIFSESDMIDMKNKYQREYKIIMQDIFNSPIKEISSKGLQVLSIPNNVDIPEWCLEYIDYDTITNNILGQFKGVLDIFGINCPEVGKMNKVANRKTKRFSNIVRF